MRAIGADRLFACYRRCGDSRTATDHSGNRITHRIRLTRDHYARVDDAGYSIDPRIIGRFVDVSVCPTTMVARCDNQIVAPHDR
ncbi:Mu transposase domain-containing protein (plasmid) [Rhodococcus globerulus]|uniref:Mu transposase domain-containing protein n=1 Tax=Rhodococcus globerulus TaxID=33008 RepID=UPI0039E91908